MNSQCAFAVVSDEHQYPYGMEDFHLKKWEDETQRRKNSAVTTTKKTKPTKKHSIVE